MTTSSKITFGVELEFLVPYLQYGKTDPAADDPEENRPLTRVPGGRLDNITAVQVQICEHLRDHKIPVDISSAFDNTQDWCIDGDMSVMEGRHAFGYDWAGIELKSPVLTADDKESFAQVVRVVTLLRQRFRIRVNQTTGFHVHVGMGAATLPPRAIHRMTQLLWAADGMLSGLHPPDRALLVYSCCIRHSSNLVLFGANCWRDNTSAIHDKGKPKRDVRRGSLQESFSIRDRLQGDEEPHAWTEPDPIGLEPISAERDERAFITWRARHHRNKLRGDLQRLSMHDTIRSGERRFGNWKWPEEEEEQRDDDANDDPTQLDKNSWIMATRTMVANAWAEMMDQELPRGIQKVSLLADTLHPSKEHVAADKGETAAIPASAPVHATTVLEVIDDSNAQSFARTRVNPYQDAGARLRFKQVNGIEMTEKDEAHHLKTHQTASSSALVAGLFDLVNPELHDDTRRAAHLIAGGRRCNYNFNMYGFPSEFSRRPMTVEFREAAGSMNPGWIATWASICAGIAKFCLEAKEDEFVDLIMKLVDSEKEGDNMTKIEEETVNQQPTYNIVRFLADMKLKDEARYVNDVVGTQDKDSFWFPCDLVRDQTSVFGGFNTEPFGEGRAVLPAKTDEF